MRPPLVYAWPNPDSFDDNNKDGWTGGSMYVGLDYVVGHRRSLDALTPHLVHSVGCGTYGQILRATVSGFSFGKTFTLPPHTGFRIIVTVIFLGAWVETIRWALLPLLLFMISLPLITLPLTPDSWDAGEVAWITVDGVEVWRDARSGPSSGQCLGKYVVLGSRSGSGNND